MYLKKTISTAAFSFFDALSCALKNTENITKFFLFQFTQYTAHDSSLQLKLSTNG